MHCHEFNRIHFLFFSSFSMVLSWSEASEASSNSFSTPPPFLSCHILTQVILAPLCFQPFHIFFSAVFKSILNTRFFYGEFYNIRTFFTSLFLFLFLQVYCKNFLFLIWFLWASCLFLLHENFSNSGFAYTSRGKFIILFISDKLSLFKDARKYAKVSLISFLSKKILHLKPDTEHCISTLLLPNTRDWKLARYKTAMDQSGG